MDGASAARGPAMRSSRRFLLTALAAAVAATATPALAQPAVPPAPAPKDAFASMPLDAAPASSGGRKVRLALNDGQTLHCELMSEQQDRVQIRIGSGAPFEVSRTNIRSIESADAPVSPGSYFRDPNITRHFYAPTGFMLRKGEGYFSQKELLFSSFGYGVTDHLSVMVGTVVPTWFLTSGQNVVGGFKFGGDVNEFLHLGAGVQGFVLPFAGSSLAAVGMAF